MTATPLYPPSDRVADLCSRWKITELAVFGSAIGADFSPDSDVDILLTFAPEAGWSLFDLVNLRQELSALFGRRVDVVEKAALRNPYRRASILDSTRTLYAA